MDKTPSSHPSLGTLTLLPSEDLTRLQDLVHKPADTLDLLKVLQKGKPSFLRSCWQEGRGLREDAKKYPVAMGAFFLGIAFIGFGIPAIFATVFEVGQGEFPLALCLSGGAVLSLVMILLMNGLDARTPFQEEQAAFQQAEATEALLTSLPNALGEVSRRLTAAYHEGAPEEEVAALEVAFKTLLRESIPYVRSSLKERERLQEEARNALLQERFARAKVLVEEAEAATAGPARGHLLAASSSLSLEGVQDRLPAAG